MYVRLFFAFILVYLVLWLFVIAREFILSLCLLPFFMFVFVNKLLQNFLRVSAGWCLTEISTKTISHKQNRTFVLTSAYLFAVNNCKLLLLWLAQRMMLKDVKGSAQSWEKKRKIIASVMQFEIIIARRNYQYMGSVQASLRWRLNLHGDGCAILNSCSQLGGPQLGK